MERAVLRDLRALGMGRAFKRSALAELALFLARAIDARDDGAAPTTTAKLASELRVTLGQLREVARDYDVGGAVGQLPAPSWDAEDAGPADAGAAGGGGGASAG